MKGITKTDATLCMRSPRFAAFAAVAMLVEFATGVQGGPTSNSQFPTWCLASAHHWELAVLGFGSCAIRFEFVLNAKLIEVVVQVLGVQAAHLLAGHASEYRMVGPVRVQLARGHLIYELQTTPPLSGEIVVTLRHERRMRRPVLAPREVQDDELEQPPWDGWLLGGYGNFAERQRQRIADMPKHLIDAHLSPSALRVRGERLQTSNKLSAVRRIVQRFHRLSFSMRGS